MVGILVDKQTVHYYILGGIIMYFVGIDISKFKHDCFITTESGEFVINSFSNTNDNDGFQELLSVLKSLDSSQEIRIGFEATAH